MKCKFFLKFSIYILCFLFLIAGIYIFRCREFLNSSSDDVYNLNQIQHRVVDQKTLTLRSSTVCGSGSNKIHCTNLSGDVYISNKTSGDWVVLIHGYTSKGSQIYNSFGAIYDYLGYNVLTPDLRGHGKSGGNVAFGYLESLDIYDWLKDLNSNWKRYGVSVAPNNIIVHGHSLGAATTLQLATNPDIASRIGGSYTKSLSELNVKGFIEEAGYTSLLGLYENTLYSNSSKIINSFIDSIASEYVFEQYQFDFGITTSNFSKYSNVFSNGRNFPAGSKILAIHGMKDNTVPFDNIDRVIKNSSPGILVYAWKPSDAEHNSFNNDSNKLKYATLISNFTKCVKNSSCKSINLY